MNPVVLYTAYIIFASILTIFVLYKYFRYFFWKKTQGKILEKKVERVQEIIKYETYKPVIKYKYTVDDKEYISDRIFITPFETDKNTASKIINEFTSENVNVYYNPFNPSESVLKKSVHAGLVVMIIALIGIMLPFLYQTFIEIHNLGFDTNFLAHKIKSLLHDLFE
ncbi:DUF3592 domain-containing protein [Sulfurihydrogenibium sp.]|uniref:DUF3592 domain-containing protein n=1 Tax=Sulfurihydrogenibium sp. TaxID=2053621 RepID=UPI00260A4D72|nr:DUF3592 domain-containing protein [Sulfurihydrogenibium sp.]